MGQRAVLGIAPRTSRTLSEIMPLDQTDNEHYAALLGARAGTSKLGKFLVSILTQGPGAPMV